jgi:hypothetical protein
VSERLWYYVQNNAQMGPVAESALKHLFRTGALTPETLVWSDLLPQWAPAHQVAALDPNGPAQVAMAQVAVALEMAPAAAGAATPAAGGSLSLSELILLNGEQFASKGGMLSNGNFDLLHTAGQVSLQDLTKVIYGALFLTLEQQGAITLQMRAKKALFGLRTVEVLTAVPTGRPMPAPDSSMEGRIQAMLAQAGPLAVEDVMYALLSSDSTNPWWDYVNLVVRGLAARGLLTTEEKKVFLGKSVQHKATQQVIAISRQDVGGIRQMLAACAPASWQLLTGAISKAVGRRTESSDDGGPD